MEALNHTEFGSLVSAGSTTKRSLIYFREVAGRTETRFIEEFKEQSDSHHVSDLLGQVWRNSEILKEKFDHLKTAFVFLALAIPPWGIALALFSLKTAASKVTT